MKLHVPDTGLISISFYCNCTIFNLFVYEWFASPHHLCYCLFSHLLLSSSISLPSISSLWEYVSQEKMHNLIWFCARVHSSCMLLLLLRVLLFILLCIFCCIKVAQWLTPLDWGLCLNYVRICCRYPTLNVILNQNGDLCRRRTVLVCTDNVNSENSMNPASWDVGVIIMTRHNNYDQLPTLCMSILNYNTESHAHVHILHTHAHMCVNAWMHAHTYACTHTHTQTHPPTHTHTHTSLVQMLVACSALYSCSWQTTHSLLQPSTWSHLALLKASYYSIHNTIFTANVGVNSALLLLMFVRTHVQSFALTLCVPNILPWLYCPTSSSRINL